MEGVMSPLFCAAMERLDLVDFWVTPFFRLSTAVPRRSKLASWIKRFGAGGKPVVVQLMARDPEIAGGAAAEIAATGLAFGLDLNFACPSKVVVQSGAGGALIKTPSLIEKITTAVKKNSGGMPVSVKIRTGFDSPEDCPDIVSAVLNGGADLICCHFRTVTEMFDPVPGGRARLPRAVSLAGEVPVTGSGDFFRPEDAAEIMSLGCAGAAAARGLLSNPALIRQTPAFLRGAVTPDKEAVGRAYFETLLELCASAPEKYLKGAAFKELAKYLLGAANPLFIKISAMKNADIARRSRELAAEYSR
jgi:tRNA-dihydrouridine synthase